MSIKKVKVGVKKFYCEYSNGFFINLFYFAHNIKKIAGVCCERNV